MTSFVTEHRLAVLLAAMGAGSMLLAGGVLFQCVRNRRRDREVWIQELNHLRNEICVLWHEMELLRTRSSEAMHESGDSRNSGMAWKGSSTGSLLLVRPIHPNSDMKVRSRASSTVSLDSSKDYVDASDKWITFTNPVESSATSESHTRNAGSEVEELRRVDELLERNEYQQVYDRIRKQSMHSCDNPSLLWKYAKACYLLSRKEDKKSNRKENIIREGKKLASKAYELDRDNFEALKWLTLLTGAATDYCEKRKKIEEGQLFKELLDKALSMKPSDYVLLHLRGRYSYTVANLSWIERTVATRIFKIPLTATIAEALNDFLEAERLKPDSWIDNLLFVAKCYLAKNDETNAMVYLEKASKLKPDDEIEKENLAEVFTQLRKIKH